MAGAAGARLGGARVADPDLVRQMVDMGFRRGASRRSLEFTGNSVERAVEVIEQFEACPDENDDGTPPPEPRSAPIGPPPPYPGPPPAVRQPQRIDFAPLQSPKAVGDADFSLFAHATSGLPVVFKSSNPDVAHIVEDRIVRLVGPGTTTLRALQEGNGAYLAAEETLQTLVVVQLAELQLHLQPKRLQRAIIKLVVSLPHLVGVSRDDFRWDSECNCIHLRGSTDQLLQVESVAKAFNDVEKCIALCRDKLQAHLLGLQEDFRKELRRDSPAVAQGDPVRKMCGDYLKFIHDLWKSKLEQALADVDKFVDDNATKLIDMVLNQPQQADGLAEKFLDGAIERLELRSAVSRMSKVEALEGLWATASYLPKLDPTQAPAFRAFYDAIIKQAHQRFALSTLLGKLTIHARCAERCLPFYPQAAGQVLKAVREHDVTVVRTATGSGKSTLMPLLLLADGYRRIAVTQPRRFAAESIQAKIEEMHGPTICGFRMAGKSKNPRAPIIYITDGLLRSQLSGTGGLAFDVVVIDEVHERSMEIDACVALLALRKKRSVTDKSIQMPKVILSSATFDDKVMAPFTDAGATFANLDYPVEKKFKCREHYADKPCASACQICFFLRRGCHHFDVVTKLHSMLEGNEQLLCFLPSQKEVMDAVSRFNDRHINSKPLYAQQNGRIQLEYLRVARVFFSTNIAETSLTFPNLRFVVDGGLVQRPRLVGELAVMETVKAPIATLRQRMGRVGRTMNGDYVALYLHASRDDRTADISPKMELERREDLLFSIQCQIREEVDLRFPALSASERLGKVNDHFYRYPEVGGRRMADSLHAALTRFHCGEDILLFAALRMSIQPKMLQDLASTASSLPFPSTNGDISTAVSVLRSLDMRMTHMRGYEDMVRRVTAWCNQHGLSDFCSPLVRAYQKYYRMRKHYVLPTATLPHNKSHPIFAKVHKPCFDDLGKKWNGFAFGRKNADGSPDMRFSENFDVFDTLKSAGSDFKKVVQSLAAGFCTSYFVNCGSLDGPKGYYSRISDMGDGGDGEGPDQKLRTIYSLHSKSTLAKKKPTVIFALDNMLFGADMADNEDPFRLGVLQLIEGVDSLDEIPADLKGNRRVLLDSADSVSHPKVTIDGKQYCRITGDLKDVMAQEIKLRQELRVKDKVELADLTKDAIVGKNVAENIKVLHEEKNIFTPLKWLWSNQHGAQVEVHLGNAADPHFTVEGRRRDVDRFKGHMRLWKKQLRSAPMVQPRPDHFTAVELYRRPKKLAQGEEEFRERLRDITAPELSDARLFHLSVGPKATRESRMMLVARIAVQQFGCKLCGGFVRDWLVRGEREHPARPLADWVLHKPPPGLLKYDILEGVLPKDLDLELPMDKYFDVNRFVSEVRLAGITVDHHEHVAQRHVFLFERERGAFSADLIEPHFAALHTLADFDVNTLCLVAYQDLVGLKMRYQLEGGTELTVDSVIAGCLKKQLVTMQPTGGGIIADRERKMKDRGWHLLGNFNFVPANPRTAYTVVLVQEDTDLFREYRDKLKTMIKKGSARLTSMYQIKSSTVDAHYDAMKTEFGTLPGGANERSLFHGTKDASVENIMQGGFDDHYWNARGYFGRGAYFADDPNLSASFVAGSNPRTMFVCSVLLGTVHDLSATPLTQAKGADFYPPHGFQSVKGCVKLSATENREMEYIVYRYGQAKPSYLLRFDM